MEIPVDETRCPLCGRANRCGAHAPGRCWCVDETFPPGLLALVPPHLTGKACICAVCRAAYDREHPAGAAPPRPVLRLQTARLWLRELAVADAPFLCGLMNEPAYLRHIGDRGVRTDDDARVYLRERYEASYRKHGFGMWRVALRADDTPVGICGLVRRDYLPEPDVGFAFLEQHAGRGYATESGLEVVRHARAALGCSRLLGITNPENAGSQRVLSKLGQRFERMIRAPGVPQELMLFATGG